MADKIPITIKDGFIDLRLTGEDAALLALACSTTEAYLTSVKQKETANALRAWAVAFKAAINAATLQHNALPECRDQADREAAALLNEDVSK